MSFSKNSIESAKKVFVIESKAITSLSDRLDSSFIKSLEILKNCSGKVIVTGMGKSGLIARKMAATFSSTGTPAFFLHPAESSHGDLGVISSTDVVLAISYGGESNEMNSILRYTSRKGVPLITMTGNLKSRLGKAGDAVLNIGIEEEACPLGLAPTTSTIVTMAFGDALAVALMKEKNVSKENFAEFHPGGSLGRKLLTRVKDIMHDGDSLPLALATDSVRSILSEMTKRNVQGVVGVTGSNGELIGVVTDGDVRRNLEKDNSFLEKSVKDIMSVNPKTIDAEELAEKALFLMEQFKIQLLFTVEGVNNKPVGIIHLQDLLKHKIC